ncbi:AAC_HP2_G0018950.mRNA.1.CDS.1 [Saccharomyces cerevisiae]|nr:AAC_HP2_G0018950.mRNA.1.CDS.1 [Saccharomyces cerevisiae]CAI6516369.1 AAC_HP2_G0018950.mRNA.1.CDS.1 [Saccharomyces cerevisiae]CAI6521916.1 AAC_HP1_G0020150.mRNA.1.CDS.1 [Saccharomyces cerevisiae]CAI6667761.1 AAC_collapsed_G0019480.mRNA.1.CDS.1 [Saccharomyces cerevisiae]
MGTSIVNLNQKIELPPIQVLFESLNRENETKPHFEERRLYQPNPSFVPRTNIAVGSPVNPVPVSFPCFFHWSFSTEKHSESQRYYDSKHTSVSSYI